MYTQKSVSLHDSFRFCFTFGHPAIVMFDLSADNVTLQSVSLFTADTDRKMVVFGFSTQIVPSVMQSEKSSSLHINEPRFEKTGLRGFRPGPIQTGLCSHRRWLET